jgi:hypothetical protein
MSQWVFGYAATGSLTYINDILSNLLVIYSLSEFLLPYILTSKCSSFQEYNGSALFSKAICGKTEIIFCKT